MKWRIFAPIVGVVLCTVAHAAGPIGEIPSEGDCLGLIAVLPTFYSEGMKSFYEKHPDASGKDLVEQLRLLADGGDKDAQFTYGMLLLHGYCVPEDLCAGRRYVKQSRGGKHDWERQYPAEPSLVKKAETTCN